MTTATHIPVRGARRRTLFALAGFAACAGLFHPSPASASAYGWPVKPFFQQHPVRGFFGDPRIAENSRGVSHSVHFGVDISAPDGTSVYATLSGRIYVEGNHPHTVAIKGDDGMTVFSYWHVDPTVRTGQRATAYRTVIGRIGSGWEHVHFAELRNGRHVNPLRRGAMGPYRDRTRPSIGSVAFERNRSEVGRELRGRVDIVAEAYDRTPLRAPLPWTGKPVTPALVRWRVVGPGGAVTRWRTAVDFRMGLPTSFDGVYARGTRQNRPSHRGRYRFVLTRRWDTRTVRDGAYRLEVRVADTRGNTARSYADFTVRNSAFRRWPR
jgi:hypothetical protein